jgi:Bacterial Ig-like domain (group 3)/FG-GAP-like repeat
MSHWFSYRSFSACIVTVFLVWMGPGRNAAIHTLHRSHTGYTNRGLASAFIPPTNLGRSQTTIASLTNTTAQINVFGFGFTAPSGLLSFTDATTGNPVAPTVMLDTATATTALSPQATTSTGANSSPDWTELADLNDDGILDLITSLSGTDSITVRLGNGDGGFGMATTILISAGFAPGEAHAVSLRGNGTMDIVIASSKTNQFAVLLGNGNGTFQMPVFYTVGSSVNIPSSFTSGDFNDDGHFDIAVANGVDNTVSIFLGNGAGALTLSGVPINVGHNPEAIRAGNFKGILEFAPSDLAVANYEDGTVTTLLNNQNGTFTADTISVGSGAGSGPRALAMTQYPYSGSLLQLAVANFRDNTVSVLRGDGSGGFGTQTIVPVGRGPDDIRFADFNGDGIQDLAVANYTDGTLNLVLGSSGATYQVLGPFSTGGHPDSAAVGDLDDDGTPDIVVSNSTTDRTGVLLTGVEISVPYTGLSLTPGNMLYATYTPDEASKYRSSSSSKITVKPFTTTTGVATSGSPSTLNEAVTFTATVASTGGSIPDGGTVTFYDGASQIGVESTAAGVAKFTTSSLSAKTHTIKATYAGGSEFKTSSGTVKQVVELAPAKTSLVSGATP